MRNKLSKGIFFLALSFLFLLVSFSPRLSGGTIGVNTHISLSFIISIIFFFLAILVFVARQTLDAIMIPTGTFEADKRRTERAYEEGKEEKGQIYLISGRIDKPIKTSQVYAIYKQLRSHDIRLGNIIIEGKSANTLENVLFSLEKLKKRGAHDVGIASNPIHLDRFEYVIKKAKEEGIIDKDFRVHRLEVPETPGEHIYGVVSNWLYRYELRKGLAHAEKPWFHKWIKKIISYIAEKT